MTNSPHSRLSSIRRRVLRWADTLDRPLPWRAERDPWRVLCSEVMLQQTQAARVAAFYPGFMKRFPTPEAMASAPPADVLRAWGNLGYNRRALNLWRAAREIADRGFPRTVAELETLPGVGPYTARAVASFAFGVRVGAVDANVKRVIVRLFGPDVDVQDTADRLAGHSAARWNQAMIDLGAVVCTARRPRCDRCPVGPLCEWTPTPAVPRTSVVPFERTSRYARGKVVEALRAGPSSIARLRSSTNLEGERLNSAVTSLVHDGLAHRRGRVIELGPAIASRR